MSIDFFSPSVIMLDHRASAWKEDGILNDGKAALIHSNFKLREMVRLNTFVSVKHVVHEKRYISQSGFRPHSATEHGMLWIDTKTGNSLFAINESPFGKKDADCATLGSRNLSKDEIPEDFWKSLKEHNILEDSVKCAYFVDGKKKQPVISSITLH